MCEFALGQDCLAVIYKKKQLTFIVLTSISLVLISETILGCKDENLTIENLNTLD